MTNMFLVILSIWMIESTEGTYLQSRISTDYAGHLMMKEIFVTDVNRIVGSEKYTLQDRFDKHKSFEMARIYMRYYLPRKWCIEDAANLWRYGPVGRWSVPKRNRYSNKVMKRYKELTK